MFKKLMVITVIVVTSITVTFGQHNFRFAQKSNKFNVEADLRISQGLLPLTYDFFDNIGARLDGYANAIFVRKLSQRSKLHRE